MTAALPLARPAGMPWYEWPLLGYFMLHFFPPAPAALANGCLLLATIGVGVEVFRQRGTPLRRLGHPLAAAWLLLAGLLGLSVLQVPPELRGASLAAFTGSIGRGTFFAALLVLHLDEAGKARRLMIAGLLAGVGMLLHFGVDTWQVMATKGGFPIQRDYLYWLLVFFPFALGSYALLPRWRVPAALVAAAVIALAVTTGFRGAMLALGCMILLFAGFVPLRRVLAGGAIIAVVGVAILLATHPEQGAYILHKLQQTDSSNRVTGHWMPAWDMALQAPWAGYGFGHAVFRHFYGAFMPQFPAWTPAWSNELGWLPASPHSIVFEALFAAGFPGLVALALFAAAFTGVLGLALWRRRETVTAGAATMLALATLVSFVGNFLVISQFESPNWRSLAVLAGLAVAAMRLMEKSAAESTAP